MYRMLDPLWDPFSPGFRAVANALRVDPVQLVDAAVSGELVESEGALRQATAGDARAFEILPAMLHGLSSADRDRLSPCGDAERRVLGAAGVIAAEIWRDQDWKARGEALIGILGSAGAFFFGRQWMDPERIVAATPDAMRSANVYGAFDLSDFARHRR